MLARSIGGYWLKNRDSEVFQNRNLDNRDAGFSKLDKVNNELNYIEMYLERPADNR